MSASQPVLVSIKSEWARLTESPVIGKDVLELLSSSMYLNPLSIYREYVQNAADSIEEAIGLGQLTTREKGRVDIQVDPEARTVRIRDNGTGISRAAFTRVLVSLGASRKRGTKARGFRGVGRLAGLGYCQELTFRSQYEGDRHVSEIRWDCRRFKAILRDPAFNGNVEDLIKEVVRTHYSPAQTVSDHFFEVELRGIVRHGNDRLVSSEEIRSYLSQVAPIPFSPEFMFGGTIEATLREKVRLGTINIYLNNEKAPLYRPYNNCFTARKGVIDQVTDVRFFDLRGDDDELAASGWIIDHGYLGAIDNAALIKGLRLRSGDMQVGEADVLDHLFPESRFNAWAVGEIHVLDDRILPNGRRDHFEQSVHFNNLLSQLRPIAQDVSRRCRQSSVRRNVIRQVETLLEQVSHNISILNQGVMGPREHKRLQKETDSAFKQMEKLSVHVALDTGNKDRLSSLLRNATRKWEKAQRSGGMDLALKRLSSKERPIFERVFALVYDCSASKQSAKVLIDRILERL